MKTGSDTTAYRNSITVASAKRVAYDISKPKVIPQPVSVMKKRERSNGIILGFKYPEMHTIHYSAWKLMEC